MEPASTSFVLGYHGCDHSVAERVLSGKQPLRASSNDYDAVIRFLHSSREGEGNTPFDTVRAVFVEGTRLYDKAGFAAKNPIQLCVRDIACIKGYFRPLGEDGKPLTF